MPHVQYVTVFLVARKQLSVFVFNGISLTRAVVKYTWMYTSIPNLCFVSTLFIEALKLYVLYMFKIVILEFVQQMPTVNIPQKPRL